MRWGFDGMLQVQFRGLKYSVSLGNLTIDVDGIKVRIEGLYFWLILFPPQMPLLKVRGSCVCFFCVTLPGGGGDAYEQVPIVLLLFSADRCSAGLHVALLFVTQVH